jgi:hypothetical protein
MFTPFFLRRKKNYPLLAMLGGSVQYHEELEKITYIQPGRIQVVPCHDIRSVSNLSGIPFDIEALVFLLKNVNPENCILPWILDQVDDEHEDDPVFFCPGSISKEGVPFLQIPTVAGEKITIGTVQSDEPLFTENGYVILYKAA